MINRPIDPERLAALLDGTLDPEERDRLLAQVAASDADAAVFGDTAEVLRVLEAEAAVTPDGRCRRLTDFMDHC